MWCSAYSHFWDNDVVGDLQGEFDAIWTRVAAHFRDNPWVIGYDPFNEPYGQGLPPEGDGVQFDAAAAVLLRGSRPSRDGSVREADHLSGG